MIENIKIKDFSLRPFKIRLLEVLKNFHSQFLSDMIEYLNHLERM